MARMTRANEFFTRGVRILFSVFAFSGWFVAIFALWTIRDMSNTIDRSTKTTEKSIEVMKIGAVGLNQVAENNVLAMKHLVPRIQEYKTTPISLGNMKLFPKLADGEETDLGGTSFYGAATVPLSEKTKLLDTIHIPALSGKSYEGIDTEGNFVVVGINNRLPKDVIIIWFRDEKEKKKFEKNMPKETEVVVK